MSQHAAWFFSAKPAGVLREAASNKEYIRFGEADTRALEAAFQEFQDTLLPTWRSDTAEAPSGSNQAKSPLPPAGEPLPPTIVIVR